MYPVFDDEMSRRAEEKDRLGPTVLAERYELGDLLGRGGMAEVHSGHDRQLDRRVAIKLLARAAEPRAEYARRLRREAMAIASLNHPAVVTVHDIDVSGDTIFIVMEHLDGETVRAHLHRKGRLAAEEAIQITSTVCDALDAAHAREIVHRDITPTNIMICSDGATKLLDFGIAHVADEGFHTKTGSVLGTVAYLSPEHVQGRVTDARSDLYSLGCCLYEMLTGYTPFRDATPVGIAYKHVNERPEPPRSIIPETPAALQAVVLRALAKDPAARYANAAEMRADLEGLGTGLRHSPETTATTSTSKSAGSPTSSGTAGEDTPIRHNVADSTQGSESRRRTGVILIAIAATALLLAVAGLSYQALMT